MAQKPVPDFGSMTLTTHALTHTLPNTHYPSIMSTILAMLLNHTRANTHTCTREHTHMKRVDLTTNGYSEKFRILSFSL